MLIVPGAIVKLSKGNTGPTPKYSDELLECVQYLLSVHDPMAQESYGSGLNQYTPHPSETLWIIRNNAQIAITDILEGNLSQFVPEDMDFIEVEMNILYNHLSQIETESSTNTKITWISAAALISGIMLSVFPDLIQYFVRGLIAIGGLFFIIFIIPTIKSVRRIARFKASYKESSKAYWAAHDYLKDQSSKP